MLSNFIRVAQLLELFIYALVAWASGLSLAQGAAMVGAAFLLTRLVFVASLFALASVHGGPRAPEHRIGAGATLAMVLREYRWFLLFNVLYTPWERFFMRADPPPARGAGPPVVLVHGYFANRGYFRPLAQRLEAAGLGPVHAPNLRSWHAPIEYFEAQLTAHLERVSAVAGRRVTVIAHSMGGLGIRAHLARHGTRHVERVVTIASPHRGTALARFAVGVNAAQMCPGSAFLAALESAEGAQGPGIPFVSIYSTHDNMVAPQETSRLPWARNVALPGMGHLETASSEAVIALVLRELAG